MTVSAVVIVSRSGTAIDDQGHIVLFPVVRYEYTWRDATNGRVLGSGTGSHIVGTMVLMGSSPAGAPAWSISLELRINTGDDAIEERSMFNNVARGTFNFASRLEAKWNRVQSGAVMFIMVSWLGYRRY